MEVEVLCAYASNGMLRSALRHFTLTPTEVPLLSHLLVLPCLVVSVRMSRSPGPVFDFDVSHLFPPNEASKISKLLAQNCSLRSLSTQPSLIPSLIVKQNATNQKHHAVDFFVPFVMFGMFGYSFASISDG